MEIKGKYNNLYGKYFVGKGTKIGSFCDIAGRIGKNCSIQSFVFIPSCVTIEDDVFIGPRVTFLNDKYPPSGNLERTLVKKGAVIGGGAVILPGIIIERKAMIGAGAVVTKDVEDFTLVYGVPAKKHGKIDKEGCKV